jgi:hypothetical protein
LRKKAVRFMGGLDGSPIWGAAHEGAAPAFAGFWVGAAVFKSPRLPNAFELKFAPANPSLLSQKH